MNNITALVNNDGIGNKSKPPKTSASEAVFIVPECCSSHELAGFIAKLEDCLSHKPKKVTLKFFGMDRLRADPALIIYDTLQRKDTTTEIVTDAKSPVIDSGVLVWLAGDRRFIRPTAWIRFLGPQSKQKNFMHQFPWEHGEWWKVDNDEIPTECTNPNYQTVLKLINKHLPVNLLADRLITPHLLDEYQLITH